jgi:hypothetical protein
MSLPYKKVHVIINPAAGKDEPILNVLNHVFHIITMTVFYIVQFNRHRRLQAHASSEMRNGKD